MLEVFSCLFLKIYIMEVARYVILRLKNILLDLFQFVFNIWIQMYVAIIILKLGTR